MEAAGRVEIDEDQFGRAPFRRTAGLALAGVIALVELTLGAAWFQLHGYSDNLARIDDLSIAFTDTQRHFQELELLAATEERFDDPDVVDELGLLERQLTIAAARLDRPGTTPQLAEDIRGLLTAFEDLSEVRDEAPDDMAAAATIAARGQQAAKSAVDRTAAMTRQSFVDEVIAAERTATVVAGVAGVVLVVGGGLLWAVLVRYQRSFDRAWELAAARRDALRHSNEQLAALADTRQRFVSVLSHELRSPLAVIGAAGETLREHHDHLDSETRGDILESLRRQVGRQQRLIDDLLLVAQHANTEPDPDPAPVVIGQLFIAISRDLVLDGSRATFDAAADAVAHVDGHHLEQVVQNLVRNAEKYGGEHIEVTAETDGAEVVVSISDDGPGVPDDVRPNLFEPYTQGDGNARDGIGLGLSISQQLVEANGGRIRHRDRPGGGTVFEVRLPRALAGSSDHAAAADDDR